jgi:hypothetical protein
MKILIALSGEYAGGDGFERGLLRSRAAPLSQLSKAAVNAPWKVLNHSDGNHLQEDCRALALTPIGGLLVC